MHALLNVTDSKSLLDQPWVGASWEGFVIEQVLGLLDALGQRHEAFYIRTSDGSEIDLVLEIDSELWSLVTKLTSSPSPQDLSRLDGVADRIGANRRFLVSQTRQPSGNDSRASWNLVRLLEWIEGRFAANVPGSNAARDPPRGAGRNQMD